MAFNVQNCQIKFAFITWTANLAFILKNATYCQTWLIYFNSKQQLWIFSIKTELLVKIQALKMFLKILW